MRLLLTTALALHREPRGTALYGPSRRGAGAASAALEQVQRHLGSPVGVGREHPWVLLPFPNPVLSTPSPACLAPGPCWASSPRGSPTPFPLLSCPATPTADSSDFPHGMSSSHTDSMFLLQSSWGNTQTQHPPGMPTPGQELNGKQITPYSSDHPGERESTLIPI